MKAKAPIARRRRKRGDQFVCRHCGQVFTAYAPAERHVDQAHGAGQIAWEQR